ncbi:uncharacterized protein BDZ99DRAFT_403196 [Mytilinidion resinicola]|uniref:Pre-mRNA-splicing factor CWC24 n=1 Tax=Mytilinidion resinicola TaxID=574789 RepID=A0A6A6XYA9_9PEZI|nr:uncharacterized protein BDZ99DRAFT_403196 [Mytilinidion resinicola]KAF2801546.1 hypothetical protein BDZ99DRAFT_403196 [Mytilinidion resinicola]
MDGPVAVFKKRAPKGTIRKAPPPPSSDSDSSSGSDVEGDDGRMVKRRKTTGVLKSSTADQKTKTGFEGATKFDADRSATIQDSNDATKQSNWYDENANDALSSKNLLGTTRKKPETSFIQKNADAPNRQVGPMKAPTNIRTITVTDYAPDVCKDYKQTGFCGFGDNCKFLHAREDYAQGWKIDRDWEASTKGKKQSGTIVASRTAKIGSDDEDEADSAILEKIPFACIICKEPYKSPVTTKCGHYFCQKCAFARYRKDPSCAACGASTSGIFNTAQTLHKLLDRKQKREDKRKAKEAKEKGEDEKDD